MICAFFCNFWRIFLWNLGRLCILYISIEWNELLKECISFTGSMWQRFQNSKLHSSVGWGICLLQFKLQTDIKTCGMMGILSSLSELDFFELDSLFIRGTLAAPWRLCHGLHKSTPFLLSVWLSTDSIVLCAEKIPQVVGMPHQSKCSSPFDEMCVNSKSVVENKLPVQMIQSSSPFCLDSLQVKN